MNPFSPGQDVFQTQADTRFNSFSDPMNSVNQNGGGWGINSNYMTPSYMSPYRPQYQGPQGDMGGNFQPSWSQSASFMANPFRKGGTNYGGNSWQQQSPFFDTIGNRPMDHAANFMQNTAMPLAAGYYGFRGLEGIGSRMGSSLFSGAARGLMGPGALGGAGSMGMTMAGGLGGMAGGIALPMLGAHMAMGAFNGAMMDPYIAQRQMTNNFRSNFAGINFGSGSAGNDYTGGGMSRGFASNMAGSMSRFAAKDLTFDQKDVAGISDLASRSGLLDTSNPQQITSKLKDITRQVKLVMAVANTSDFRDAIEILGKLQMSGATGTAATRAMSSLSGFAAMGGVSVQKMMNTVGAQGQMMFGQNGLTPFVGQMAAGQAQASMSAAFRNGLMSPALAARFGGVEGATQSAVAGSVSLANSPYAAMYAMNGYLGGGERGSIVGNMSRFGGGIAGGGLSAIGQFNLARPGLMSKALEQNRLGMTQDLISQIGRTTPGAMRNGRVDSGAAYEILTQTMGLPEDQARAVLQELKGYQNKGVVSQMMTGNNTALVNSRMKFMEQQGADYGRLTGGVQSVLGVGRSIQSGGASMINSITGSMGGGLDALQNWYTEAKFGKAKDMQDVTLDSLSGTENISLKGYGLGSGRDRGAYMNKYHNKKAFESIREAVSGGNADAKTFLSAKGREQKDALTRLIDAGIVDKSFADDTKRGGLLSDLGQLGRVQEGVGRVSDAIADAYSGIKGVTGVIAKGQYTTLVKKLMDAEEGSPEYKKLSDELANVMGKKPGDLDISAVRKIINSDDTKYALTHGTFDYSGAVGVKDEAAYQAMIKDAGGIDALAAKNLTGKFKESFDGADNKEYAYAAMMQAQKGGAIKGGNLKNVGHVDARSLNKQLQTEAELRSQRDNVRNLAADHKIDFTTEMAMSTALDNKEAVGVFANSVRDFSEAVKSMPGASSKNSNGETTWDILVRKMTGKD